MTWTERFTSGGRAFEILKPSLFYLLNNYGLFTSDRLVWALYYQMVRPWDQTPSYVQILQAFDDRLARHLLTFRQMFGELDEEPLAHLALEQGLIDVRQLELTQQLCQAEPQTYPGKLMIEHGFLTEDQLERLLLFPHFKITPEREEIFAFRGLRLMEQRLWLRGYISRPDAENLGLLTMMRLPLDLKPLADLLVLNGEMPTHLQSLICPNPPLTDDPLWHILELSGLKQQASEDVLQRFQNAKNLIQSADPETAADSVNVAPNLALRLVESGLISQTRLSNLILLVMRAQLPKIRIQGATSPEISIWQR